MKQKLCDSGSLEDKLGTAPLPGTAGAAALKKSRGGVDAVVGGAELDPALASGRARLALATEVAEGLAYLHKQRVWHRDMKPGEWRKGRTGWLRSRLMRPTWSVNVVMFFCPVAGNVLLTACPLPASGAPGGPPRGSYLARIADFGVSRAHDIASNLQTMSTTTVVGTPVRTGNRLLIVAESQPLLCC